MVTPIGSSPWRLWAILAPLASSHANFDRGLAVRSQVGTEGGFRRFMRTSRPTPIATTAVPFTVDLDAEGVMSVRPTA